MATKTKKEASSKKATPKAEHKADHKGEHKPEHKTEKKSAKAAHIEEDDHVEAEVETPQVDQEELEEQEEQAAAESAGQNGNAAALAAAAGNPTEMSASFKNFRHHPDMENFYRFIYENDLRHEALAIIDEIMAEKLQRRLVKGVKAQAH